MWIDYDMVHLQLWWNEVKDKKLIHHGDEDEGVLIIADSDDIIIKIIGYEKIDELDGEE